MKTIMKKGESICPCCGKIPVIYFDICENCGWQNDTVQLKYPAIGGGANKMSLEEAKKAYAEGRKIE